LAVVPPKKTTCRCRELIRKKKQETGRKDGDAIDSAYGRKRRLGRAKRGALEGTNGECGFPDLGSDSHQGKRARGPKGIAGWAEGEREDGGVQGKIKVRSSSKEDSKLQRVHQKKT